MPVGEFGTVISKTISGALSKGPSADQIPPAASAVTSSLPVVDHQSLTVKVHTPSAFGSVKESVEGQEGEQPATPPAAKQNNGNAVERPGVAANQQNIQQQQELGSAGLNAYAGTKSIAVIGTNITTLIKMSRLLRGYRAGTLVTIESYESQIFLEMVGAIIAIVLLSLLVNLFLLLCPTDGSHAPRQWMLHFLNMLVTLSAVIGGLLEVELSHIKTSNVSVTP